MRGAPQVGFSATTRKINSRSSLLVGFLPPRIRFRESHFQYSLNPARCQRTTVSGWTIRTARFQPDQNRLRMVQKILSGNLSRGRGCFRTMTESCCRKARFSSRRSWRERKNRAQNTMTKQNVRNIYLRLPENARQIIVLISKEIGVFASHNLAEDCGECFDLICQLIQTRSRWGR